MIRVGRFIRQINRHARREKRLSLGSFLVLVIILVLVDLFWVASINVTNEYNDIAKTVRMEVFINDAMPDSALPAVETAIRSFGGVSDVRFVSKDDAARLLTQYRGPGLLEGLEYNPLPRSFVASFDHMHSLEFLDGMQQQLMRIANVDTVEFGREWIVKVENAGRQLRQAGYGVGGLILFVVLLTMFNTNRLTARSKSRDFHQLKLLGAGPSYLLYPFLAEGFASAFLAALLGWALIFYLSTYFSFTRFELVLPESKEIAVYALCAGATGMIGAYLGIRRLLVR